jgi:excisionase family DNA binding protein
MKIEIEQEDIKAIALEVTEMLKPLLLRKIQKEDETFLTVKDLQIYLKVSQQWIYERTHLKEIPHIKIDGQLRFRKKDIDKWVSSFSIPAVSHN